MGYFIEPTLVEAKDPGERLMCEEIFGPVLTYYVYPDEQWTQTLNIVDSTSPYALTGAIFSRDRRAVREATHALRNAAGNFYINDKPTGAVVGQQPFGGRARLGHQRQGRFEDEPDALGPGPHDQGDVRARHRLALPVHVRGVAAASPGSAMPTGRPRAAGPPGSVLPPPEGRDLSGRGLAISVRRSPTC